MNGFVRTSRGPWTREQVSRKNHLIFSASVRGEGEGGGGGGRDEEEKEEEELSSEQSKPTFATSFVYKHTCMHTNVHTYIYIHTFMGGIYHWN
jgi:hypothetical protein